MKNVGMISLGCDKNRVDAEKMLGKLKDGGYNIVSDPEKADVIIVNTCAFIESAKKEAIDSILDACEYKKNGTKIVVTGCFSERYFNDFAEGFPEVDAFLKLSQNENILDVVNGLCGQKSCAAPCLSGRVLTTPYNYAYLKIADGCNNRCSFCAIPSIRGNYVSEDEDLLVDEAKRIIDGEGVSELIIVAQDTTRYGFDKTKEYRLVKLLDKLSAIDGLKWLRVLYLYPEFVTNDLIKYISKNEKVAKYMDIPLQHVNDRILKSMRRRNDGAYAKDLIDRIRNIDEEIAIRSSFIVGYPGETDEEFAELKDFIADYKLDYAGFFGFSPEEDTPAFSLDGRVKKSVVNKRLREIRSLQSAVMVEKARSYVGKTLDVVYEGIDYDKQLFFGRSQFCAPEIDSRVLFKSKEPIEIGNYYKVKITKVNGFDPSGEVIE